VTLLSGVADLAFATISRRDLIAKVP